LAPHLPVLQQADVMTTASCLQHLDLREQYRSDDSDLVRDFYVPCLTLARTYDRAVGYFTSEGLALAAEGLDAFVAAGGQMRLVASPVFSAEDAEAMRMGLAAKASIVERRLLEALQSNSDSATSTVRLAWLLADGRLEIRVAVPTDGPGIYHEKVGVFRDVDGCLVSFSGSANETVGGLVSNFESNDVFCSWDWSGTRARRKLDNFERLWRNETPRLQVIDLPAAVRSQLVQIAVSHPRPKRSRPRQQRGEFSPPPGLQLRPYQLEGIEAWFAAHNRGVISMATGTGKTKTGLAAAHRLAHGRPGGMLIVIVTPYVNLVDQWAEECDAWQLRPIKCYESTGRWRAEVWREIDAYRAGTPRTICLVTTYATAALPEFQQVIAACRLSGALVIADEVHHLESELPHPILKCDFGHRLGLSATPARWEGDMPITQRLESYFGSVVYEFSIRDAIRGQYLCPYIYEPILVQLDPEELRGYTEVVRAIDSVLARTPLQLDELSRLLRRRSLLLNTASGKFQALRETLRASPPDRTLFYCASRAQMDPVTELVRESGLNPRPFTAEESSAERKEILDGLARGTIPALVAMRALDEGVDVPSIREAHILASSGNPREFVQRRGRVLRPHPGKTHARIVDYIVMPDVGNANEQNLARRELRRVLDFAATASNGARARTMILPLLERYGLLHLVGETL
jgi:superfamily II DNA or RNA helicase